MRVLEYQAKQILAGYDIPVPGSKVIRSASDLAGIPLPAVLKAQIPTGGRGKAGGIRLATDKEQARAIAQELLGSEIKGCPVRAILAEEKADVSREIYLAVLFDQRANLPLVMASAAGGVDIEQVAEQSPEQIVSRHINPFVGPQPYTLRYLAEALGLDAARFGSIIRQMYDLLWAYDATLVEINPLAETPDGLMALDAKMVLDDKAAYRHPDLFASLREEQEQTAGTEKTRAEQLADQWGITYVLMDGTVGLISDGAGTGMLALDLIRDAGGRAANFCELGGLTSPEVMCQAMEVVLANPSVKALLISLIGGVTRMDEMAEGIVQYLKQNKAPVPMVIRMYGTRAEVGQATLRKAGIGAFENLPEAVEQAVALARAT